MMTKDEMLKTYESIDSSGFEIATQVKTGVLEFIIDSFNRLPEEEKDTFPENFADDIRLLYFHGVVGTYMDCGNIKALKKFVEEELDPIHYRNELPEYRVRYALEYALACVYLVGVLSIDEEQADLWTYRGLKAIETAINILVRMEDLDYLACAIDVKVSLLKNKSIKEGIDFVQGMLSFSNDEKYMETLSSLWKDLNKLRFEKFFDSEDVRFIDSLPFSDELKDEIITNKFPRYRERQFCSIEPYYDRGTILVVNDILDINKEELKEVAEDAQYIFEVDHIPADIRFIDGQPQSGTIYIVDENEPDLYHPEKQ